jgi:hypothetical protein
MHISALELTHWTNCLLLLLPQPLPLTHKLQLYNVNPTAGGASPPFSHRATFSKAHSFITHLDFGTIGGESQSAVLQCTTGDYELLFFSAEDGKHITSAAAVRDADWSSSTCTLGWGVQGIWPKGADGTDVVRSSCM